MKIHVASFFDKKNHRGGVLSIAVSLPKGFDIKTVNCLVPSWRLVSRYKTDKIDEKDYTVLYEQEVLNHLTPFLLRSQIIKAAGRINKEVTLLCWEKEGEFCHRTLVYKWLKKWKKEKPNIRSFVELGEMH